MHDERQERHEAREDNEAMSAARPESTAQELAGPEWRKHLALRPTTELGIDAAALLAEERARRDAETA